jgi:membrane-associated phospholipid phosphatase
MGRERDVTTRRVGSAQGRDAGAAFIVGVVALLGFGLQTYNLGLVEWHDAYVAAFFGALRGCGSGHFVAWVTNAAPYAGVAFVVGAAVLARARGTPVRDIVAVLAYLGIALLVVQGFKLILGRVRPGVPPWLAVGHSFPSGHVANVALALAAGARLVPRAPGRTDPVRVGLVVTGLALVPVVAFTRLYLGRHWVSDVIGSVLLSTGLWGVVIARRAAVLRRVVICAAVVGSPVYLAAASGVRIHLPSPAMFSSGPRLAVPLRHAALLPHGAAAAVWVPRPGTRRGGFLRLTVGNARLRVRVRGDSPRAVLKVVGRPLRGIRGERCRWLQLLVDGEPLEAQYVKPRARTYAFALPLLADGAHEIRLRILADPTLLRIGEPTLAVHRLSIDGAVGRIAVAPVVSRGHLDRQVLRDRRHAPRPRTFCPGGGTADRASKAPA